MSLPRVSLIVPVLVFGLSGCGAYDPSVTADHASEKYKTDIAVCRTSSAHAVYLKNAATLGSWLISPITGPPAVRKAIRDCMRSKGYMLAQN